MDEDRKKKDRQKKLKEKSFLELYKLYYQHKRNYETKKSKLSKKIMKDILSILDVKVLDQREKQIIQNSYLSYPDYNDPDFVYDISRKAEFFHCKNLFNLMELENKCSSRNFELGNHQQFLKKFINKNTPYRGLLVFHGVGVGKTCTAVTISNSFRDIYKNEDKKIICLVSKNIQSNWKNTIYDPSKGENQCTGDSFYDLIQEMDQKNITAKVKKMIKQFYEFYGYQQFSNKVKLLLKIKLNSYDTNLPQNKIDRLEKEVIEKYFSDRILIVDEIHNLRDDSLVDHSKEALEYLDKVVRYSKNLRLIVMSATPMFNKATEIQWLLNLLLKNDNRPTISSSEIFDKNGFLTKGGTKSLREKTKGYVSYVRGENPITFPIRLYPDNNDDERCIVSNYPFKNLWGKNYSSDNYQFKFLKMYYNQINGYQKDIYNQYLTSLDESKEIQIMEQRVGAQISNIVYPSIEVLLNEGEINYSTMYGGKGFQNIMIPKIKNKRRSFTYKKEYKKKIQEPIFDLKNIGKISTKIQNILSGIKQKKSKGILFIYSEFIPSGIIPLALALEHMGFEKYSGNLLDYPEWSKDKQNTKNEPIDHEWTPITKKKGGFKQAKYVILSGDKTLSPNNDEEIKQLTSDKNINGENIKIVLGSVVASEGLDLKNIREIHVLDPWYHLSRVEQIIGRGIRYCSHLNLPKEERNVTVYLHVAGTSREVESFDTNTYRKAEEKAFAIGEVEKVLKENSIDCFLNQQTNIIHPKDIYPVKLITSRNKTINDFEVHDKKFSKICSFSDCKYNCSFNKEIDIEKDINFDTFSIFHSKDLFKNIQKIIIEMYELHNYYELDEIVKRVLETMDTNVKIIYFAIYDMIENEVVVWNNYHLSGRIVNKNEYYLFQPHHNNDEKIPLYYRNQITDVDHQEYISLDEELFQKKKKVKVYTYDGAYSSLLTYNEELVDKYDYSDYIEDLDDQIYFEIAIDKLNYDQKLVLLKDIIEEYIEDKEIEDEQRLQIFNYFQFSFIYEKGKKYFIFEPPKNSNIVGFFLFNTSKSKEKKIKEIDELENDYDYFIYKEGEFFSTSELEDGELIKSSLKQSLLKIKDTTLSLKTKDIWGYSYKTTKHVFKLVDGKSMAPNKMPGRVIEQIAKKSSIRDYIQNYFEDIYDILIEDDDKPKEFLYLLVELLIRQEEKNKTKSAKHAFIPYDLVFMKYIQ